MELALQNYERATKEATAGLLAAWATEKETLARKHRDLEEERRALEVDRAAFAAEIAGVEGMVVQPEDRVKLNIGGKKFETTRQTLTAALNVAPYSYFGAMFSGRHEGRMQLDEEGRVFINRNGSIFEMILDFLRGYSLGGENAAFAIHALPETQMKAMREELDYYGLENAVFPSVPFNIHLASFTPGPAMLSKRWGHGAVVLPENRGVLVVGGYTLTMTRNLCHPPSYSILTQRSSLLDRKWHRNAIAAWLWCWKMVVLLWLVELIMGMTSGQQPKY